MSQQQTQEKDQLLTPTFWWHLDPVFSETRSVLVSLCGQAPTIVKRHLLGATEEPVRAGRAQGQYQCRVPGGGEPGEGTRDGS